MTVEMQNSLSVVRFLKGLYYKINTAAKAGYKNMDDTLCALA